MDEDEVLEVIDQLKTILNNSGLNVLVEQEEILAAEGNPVEVDPAEAPRGGQKGRSASQVRAGDVRLVPLTPHQRLSKLLDLIEASVGGAYAVESRTLEMASEFLPESNATPSVRFSLSQEDQSPLNDSESWEIGRSSDTGIERMQAVRAVVQIVSELRRLSGSAQGDWLSLPPRIRAVTIDSPGGWG